MGEKNTIQAIFQNVFDRTLDMENYDDRLYLQKIIYLSQQAGVKLSYYFSWYIHGPYSSSLAKDGYEVSAMLREGTMPETSLAPSVAEKVERLKKKFMPYLANSQKIELLASVLYMAKDNESTEKGRLLTRLRSLKPWFSEKEISAALDVLENSRLLPHNG